MKVRIAVETIYEIEAPSELEAEAYLSENLGRLGFIDIAEYGSGVLKLRSVLGSQKVVKKEG